MPSLFSLRPWPRRLMVLALLLCGAGLLWSGLHGSGLSTQPAPAPLAQGAYVWQRSWDDQLRDSLRGSQDYLSYLAVLGLQRDAQGNWIEPAVDLAALARDGRPLELVVRLDGSAPDWPVQELAVRIQRVLQRWHAAGLAPALQLDHDCASARLGEYAAALQQLRRALPPGLRMDITGLPAWLPSAQLDALLAATDGSIVQVHAVQSPTDGLFDARLARGWVQAWARRSGAKPFRVALPAYGARLKLDADGDVEAVESEQPLPRRSAQSRELKVDPRVVTEFLHWLRGAGLSNLRGVIWFRLPRAGDSRAWAPLTLRAVTRGEPLAAQLTARWQTQSGGAQDLHVFNAGTLDAVLPARLELTGDCSAADALEGYRVRREGARWVFERTRDGELRAGRARALGWLRCARPPEVRIVQD
jgi:hypothetical protein